MAFLSLHVIASIDIHSTLVLPSDAVSLADVIRDGHAMCQQAAQALQCRGTMQRIQDLQAQYDAAEAAAEDFELIASLGLQLTALQLEAKKLPLSEKAYLTLPDRHAALVQRMTDKCKELMRDKDFDALATLSALLKAVKALDLSCVAREEEADDPVLPETELNP
jgi:hypothetical protein